MSSRPNYSQYIFFLFPGENIRFLCPAVNITNPRTRVDFSECSHTVVVARFDSSKEVINLTTKVDQIVVPPR